MEIVACEVPGCGYVTSAADTEFADVLYALHMVVAHDVPLEAFEDET